MDGNESDVVLCEEGVTEEILGEERSEVEAIGQNQGIHSSSSFEQCYWREHAKLNYLKHKGESQNPD